MKWTPYIPRFPLWKLSWERLRRDHFGPDGIDKPKRTIIDNTPKLNRERSEGRRHRTELTRLADEKTRFGSEGAKRERSSSGKTNPTWSSGAEILERQ